MHLIILGKQMWDHQHGRNETCFPLLIGRESEDFFTLELNNAYYITAASKAH